MRLMKENGLSVRARPRFIATTDSDHDGPIFSNLAKNIVPTSLNQLWVADVTYIAIATQFHLAAIPDRSECDQPYSEPGQRRDG